MALSCSSSSSDLLDECMHGAFDDSMVEDLDAPTVGPMDPGSGGGAGAFPSQPSGLPSHGAPRANDGSSYQLDLRHQQGGGAGGDHGTGYQLQKGAPGYAITAGASSATSQAQAGTSQQQQQHPFSMQLQLLTSKLQAAQQAAGRAPRVSGSGNLPAAGGDSQPNSAQMSRYPILHVDSATGMVIGTGEPGSAQHVGSPPPPSGAASGSAAPSKAQPSAFAMAANASLPAGLTPEQYQLLLDAGVDPATLLSVFQPKATPAPAPTPQANPGAGLDQAEALWQQVAASGADDQTLLSVAARLGLITTDVLTGNVVLTRDLQQQALQQQFMQPSAAGLLPVYSGTVLDSQQAAAAAVASLTGVHSSGMQAHSSNSLSAPLPRLQQQQNAALASLLGSAGFGAVRTAITGGSSGGSAARTLGSPGPGPSKQHTLYKTELCRGWLESGTCRYGSKCQFAHGPEELRPVPRHPKYKTEVCRSFTATGMCAYGSRCRFIHGSVSAPSNAILNLQDPASCATAGAIPANRVSDGLEGVLTLDDPSPTQRGVSLDAGAGGLQSIGGGMSPRSRMLLALGGGALAGARAGVPPASSGTTDLAALAHLGRLMSMPADALMGGSNRASLESVMSCRMELSAGTLNNRGRSSLGDTQRSSLDSRAGGRTSLESAQSAQDWGMRGDVNPMMAMDAPSPQKPSPQAGGSGDMYGLAQRYMPGIPEGRVLPSLPQEDAWLGAGQPLGFPQTAVVPTSGPGAAAAAAAAQLVGQLQGLSFPSGAQAAQQSATLAKQAMGLGGRTMAQQLGPSVSAPNAMPAGNWFSPVGRWSESSAVPAGGNTADTADVHKALLMSAYSSGLYASSAPASGAHGMAGAVPGGQHKPAPRRQSPSNPGLPTPERSDASMGPGSDANLAALLGL